MRTRICFLAAWITALALPTETNAQTPPLQPPSHNANWQPFTATTNSGGGGPGTVTISAPNTIPGTRMRVRFQHDANYGATLKHVHNITLNTSQSNMTQEFAPTAPFRVYLVEDAPGATSQGLNYEVLPGNGNYSSIQFYVPNTANTPANEKHLWLRWTDLNVTGPSANATQQYIRNLYLLMIAKTGESSIFCYTYINFVNFDDQFSTQESVTYRFRGISSLRARFAPPGFNVSPEDDTSAYVRTDSQGHLIRRFLHRAMTGLAPVDPIARYDETGANIDHFMQLVPSLDASLQMSAFYDDVTMNTPFNSLPSGDPSGKLLIFGTRDTEHHTKYYDLEFDRSDYVSGPESKHADGSNPLIFQVLHTSRDLMQPASTVYPTAASMSQPDGFRTPYPTYVALIRGDWYTAARYYRESFADNAPWTSEPMLTNANLSTYYKDSKAWMLGAVDHFNDSMLLGDEVSTWTNYFSYDSLYKTGSPPNLPIHLRSWWAQDSATVPNAPIIGGCSEGSFGGYESMNLPMAQALTYLQSLVPQFGVTYKAMAYFLPEFEALSRPIANGSVVPQGFQDLPPGATPSSALYGPVLEFASGREAADRGYPTLYPAAPDTGMLYAPRSLSPPCDTLPAENVVINRSHTFYGDMTSWYLDRAFNAFAPFSAFSGVYWDRLGLDGFAQAGGFDDGLTDLNFSPLFNYKSPLPGTNDPTMVGHLSWETSRSDHPTQGTPSTPNQPITLNGTTYPVPPVVAGGNLKHQRARAQFEKARDRMRDSYYGSQFYVQSEWANEDTIGLVEEVLMKDDESNDANEISIPLFSTVYHPYVMLTRYSGLYDGAICIRDVPNPAPSGPALGVGELGRRFWSQLLHFGYHPFIGANQIGVGQNFSLILAGNLNGFPCSDPAYLNSATNLTNYLDFVRRTLRVWTHDDVRHYTIFGDRRRDPKSNIGTNLWDSPVRQGSLHGTVMDDLEWTKISPILVSAWTSFDTNPPGPNPTAAPETVGFGVINWTDPSRDGAVAQPSVTVRFRPIDYGMQANSTYSLLLIDENTGANGVAVDTMQDITVTDPTLEVSYTFSCPYMSSQFYIANKD